MRLWQTTKSDRPPHLLWKLHGQKIVGLDISFGGGPECYRCPYRAWVGVQSLSTLSAACFLGGIQYEFFVEEPDPRGHCDGGRVADRGWTGRPRRRTRPGRGTKTAYGGRIGLESENQHAERNHGERFPREHGRHGGCLGL